jgi:hypothetical protein
MQNDEQLKISFVIFELRILVESFFYCETRITSNRSET